MFLACPWLRVAYSSHHTHRPIDRKAHRGTLCGSIARPPSHTINDPESRMSADDAPTNTLNVPCTLLHAPSVVDQADTERPVSLIVTVTDSMDLTATRSYPARTSGGLPADSGNPMYLMTGNVIALALGGYATRQTTKACPREVAISLWMLPPGQSYTK